MKFFIAESEITVAFDINSDEANIFHFSMHAFVYVFVACIKCPRKWFCCCRCCCSTKRRPFNKFRRRHVYTRFAIDTTIHSFAFCLSLSEWKLLFSFHAWSFLRHTENVWKIKETEKCARENWKTRYIHGMYDVCVCVCMWRHLIVEYKRTYSMSIDKFPVCILKQLEKSFASASVSASAISIDILRHNCCRRRHQLPLRESIHYTLQM